MAVEFLDHLNLQYDVQTMPAKLMTTIEHDKERDAETLWKLGKRVREFRRARKMTLVQLSGKSQVSVGMLSHIERGQTSPSLKTLERLRVALDTSLTSFFGREEANSQEDDVVVRTNRRAKLPFDKMGLTKELLSPPGHFALEVFMLVIEPGGGPGTELWRRNGEKAGIVLEGRFELSVNQRIYVIEEGDSFQFDSRRPHSFRNLSNRQSRVLWIIKSDEPG